MLQFLSMIHWESVLVYSHTVRWLEWPRHECQSSKLLFCLFLRFFYVLFLPLAGRTCQGTSINVNSKLRSWEVETCFSRELLASAPSSLQALACSANLPPPSMLKQRQDCLCKYKVRYLLSLQTCLSSIMCDELMSFTFRSTCIRTLICLPLRLSLHFPICRIQAPLSFVCSIVYWFLCPFVCFFVKLFVLLLFP